MCFFPPVISPVRKVGCRQRGQPRHYLQYLRIRQIDANQCHQILIQKKISRCSVLLSVILLIKLLFATNTGRAASDQVIRHHSPLSGETRTEKCYVRYVFGDTETYSLRARILLVQLASRNDVVIEKSLEIVKQYSLHKKNYSLI